MTWARTILVILAAVVVGLIGYQIGISQNIAAQLPAASGAPAVYYGRHFFGWGFGFPFFGFLGFLFPLLFFFLFFGLVRAAFWGGRGWGGYGYERRRQRLEEIHRELHGEKAPSGDRPDAPRT